VVFSFISLIAYREIEPFRNNSTNLLAYIAQCTLFLTFGSALAIGSDLTHNQNTLTIGISLVLTNLIVIAFALFNAVRRFMVQRQRDSLRRERQAQIIEPGVETANSEKWATIYDDISRNKIPRSHCLVFFYTSLEGARAALRSDIPAFEGGGLACTSAGVVFTLHDPSEIDSDDIIVFPKHRLEVALACSVQKKLLYRIDGELRYSSLRILPGSVMRALRGQNFIKLIDSKPWLDGGVFLPPQQIVRAYHLVKESEDNCGSVESDFKIPPALVDVDDSWRPRVQVYFCSYLPWYDLKFYLVRLF